MRKLLLALLVALLMVGCKTAKVGRIDLDDKETLGKIVAEAIGEEMIQWRGKEGETIVYTSNQKTPYSGWMKCMDDKGQIRWLFQCKDGKYDGPSTWWYGNALKSGETTYKNGKKITVLVWKPNGEKCPVTNVVNGNGVMVYYNDDGKEAYRQTYKDGNK